MKNYLKFILEKKVNKLDPEEIYDKYYTDIEKDIFYQIIQADPTSYVRGELYVGNYSKWLLQMFKDKKLELEDLEKVTKYIITHKKFKHKYKTIDKYKDISDLFVDVKNDLEIDFEIPKEEEHLIVQFK